MRKRVRTSREVEISNRVRSVFRSTVQYRPMFLYALSNLFGGIGLVTFLHFSILSSFATIFISLLLSYSSLNWGENRSEMSFFLFIFCHHRIRISNFTGIFMGLLFLSMERHSLLWHFFRLSLLAPSFREDSYGTKVFISLLFPAGIYLSRMESNYFPFFEFREHSPLFSLSLSPPPVLLRCLMNAQRKFLVSLRMFLFFLLSMRCCRVYHHYLFLFLFSFARKIMIESWLSTMQPNGWIAREQIHGPEAEAKVTQIDRKYLFQNPSHGNPPTLLLAVEEIFSSYFEKNERQLLPSDDEAFLRRVLPYFERHIEWFVLTHQVPDLHDTFAWTDRLPGHTMTSGLPSLFSHPFIFLYPNCRYRLSLMLMFCSLFSVLYDLC